MPNNNNIMSRKIASPVNHSLWSPPPLTYESCMAEVARSRREVGKLIERLETKVIERKETIIEMRNTLQIAYVLKIDCPFSISVDNALVWG